MPTRGRPALAALAVECWRSQTIWRDTVLLILDDEEAPSFPDRIVGERIVYWRQPGRMIIGEKRNVCCAAATGKYIAHFDSDDWSSRRRLEAQLGMIDGTGKAVCGFYSILFHDDAEWWKWTGTRAVAVGTSLLYRRDWWAEHPFPMLHIQEDAEFVKTASDLKQLVTADAGNLMFARIHDGADGNTSVKRPQAWQHLTCGPPEFQRAAIISEDDWYLFR